ncbi:unnamed protein product [Ranitomeya imitator]|uniref:Uncharacterized protein n=1 Tax=Ranitomeya imitator TaxID=111125 RepID=A0ABN9LTM6_9NEOB|nr:unnamed protein product [Ranitomeya imitator]
MSYLYQRLCGSYSFALSTALQVNLSISCNQDSFFPVWPHRGRPELAIGLFASTMVLLFLPKLLSIILSWCKGTKEYGGFCRVTLSLLLAVLFSVLLASGAYVVPYCVSLLALSLAGKWYEFTTA